MNKEAKVREAAGPERLVNCIKKTRKVGESNNAGSGTITGMSAGMAVAGPLGAIVGAFGGLIGGMASTKTHYETYEECQKEKIFSHDHYLNEI
jgi:hypothetical protein